MSNRSSSVISVLTIAIAAAAPAWADDERRERPDVDIDSLKASMRYYDGSWHVSVKYEVEVEDGVPSDLRLVLYFTERGRTVLDPTGEPIEFIVPLDEPSEVDDDEIVPTRASQGNAVGRIAIGCPVVDRTSRRSGGMHEAVVGQVVERFAECLVRNIAEHVVGLEGQLKGRALEMLNQNLDVVGIDACVLDRRRDQLSRVARHELVDGIAR